MGYRLPDQQVADVASNSLIAVDNGTISRISIECRYRRPPAPPSRHDCAPQDHEGWPDPDHPDDSCQIPSTDLYDRFPPPFDDGYYDRRIIVNGIDLPGEGYDEVEVQLLDPPEGLSVTGVIDYDVVTLMIVTMCRDAIRVDVDVPFCVYVLGSMEDNVTGEEIEFRDVLTKGTLRIVAGVIGEV